MSNKRKGDDSLDNFMDQELEELFNYDEEVPVLKNVQGIKPNLDRQNIEDGGFQFDAEDDDTEVNLSDLEREIIEWEPEVPDMIPGLVANYFHTTGWVGNLHLDKILTDAVIQGVSDVHITANQVISFTRNGEIIRCNEYPIPSQDVMHELIHEALLNKQAQSVFNTELDYDGSYTIQHGPLAKIGEQRTRINVGRSFGNYFIVFRIINNYIPSIEDLKVEKEIVDWSHYPNGLFLLCGPTGTGKSTTLASVIRNLQNTTKKKIITIEKPIEYIYPDDAPSLVVQREVGNDTLGFYEGLTSAMRQNPDVILLGEVRNTEEVRELLRAAETGHLAISTMHTNSVATTINRIQNLFVGEEQRRIMSTLSDTLRGIGNQVLVKNNNDGRFAVRELLTINEEVRDLILQGDIKGIRKYQMDREATMEHKLAKAVREGKCLASEAIKHASDPMLFNSLLERP